MKLHAFLVCWLGLITLSCADDLTRTLQQKLKDQGFYYGEVNGRNSSETSAALRRYQIRYGLRVTGEADTETLRALGLTAGSTATGSTRNASPPASQKPPPVVSRATPPVTGRTPSSPSNRDVPAPPPANQDVERGPYWGDQDGRQPYDPSGRYGGGVPSDRFDDPYERPAPPMPAPPADSGVYEFDRTAPGSIFAGSVYERAPRQVQQNVLFTIQELLARRGLYRGDVDGLPGPATSEAIVMFQRDEGLPATGQLDMETLRELHALPGQRNGPPARRADGGPSAPPEDQPVYRGIWINR